MMEREVEDPYHPEIDFSPELDEKVIKKHLHLINILQWSNEIGCIDITIEVSMPSQYQCSPQEGHLDALYQIFWYFKCIFKQEEKERNI